MVSISSTFCQMTKGVPFSPRQERLALGADVVLIVALATLTALTFYHILPVLPGINAHHLTIGLLGATCTLPVLLCVSQVIKRMRTVMTLPLVTAPAKKLVPDQPPKAAWVTLVCIQEILRNVENQQEYEKQMTPKQKEARAEEERQTSFSPVYGPLYLGSAGALFKCLGWSASLQIDGQTVRDQQKISKNTTGVLLVAPLSTLEHSSDILNKRVLIDAFKERSGALGLTESTLENILKDLDIEFSHIGRLTNDAPQDLEEQSKFWDDLVYEASVLNANTEIRYAEAGEVEPTGEELEKAYQFRTQEIAKKPVCEWFTPVFAEMDRRFETEEKLIVLDAEGVSRGPALMAAYLISRFKEHGVSLTQVLTFLRSRRFCVAPTFMPQLEWYAKHCYSPLSRNELII